MKKLLIAGNLFLLGIIIFQACKSKSKPKSKFITPVMITKIDTCDILPCKNYEGIPLEGEIDGSLLTTLSVDYSADLGKAFIDGCSATKGISAPDALSVCFKLEQLKNLIWKIEHAACLSNCDSVFAIRFYYIKYPPGVGTSKAPAGLEAISLLGCEGKHSLAMVPAVRISGEYYDLDLADSLSFCPLKKGKQPGAGSKGYLTGTGDGDNHGDVGPPPPLGTFPTYY
jgi:hypothetical protein